MDRTCLLHCMLMEVLLITVYGSTEVQVNCPNQTGIVGKPLILTCNVTCEECFCKNYIWSKNNINLNDTENRACHNNRTFYHTILNDLNESEKHSGMFKFWVQMTTGTGEREFYVTIETRVPDARAVVDVCDAGERSPHGLLCCPHHSGQYIPVLGHGASKPGGDASGEKTFHSPSVESLQHTERDPEPAQTS
ncbi:hypothetical protein PGIGA_G00039690 [Pangasianodon gigas]|uniref:Uncharacterized protein n=1 Tax=Pangasianodon gigas TaxID=30993 RepID=A0ACC5X056_PANGG|nr:hypothetical protein [Pangasianodon gigas]